MPTPWALISVAWCSPSPPEPQPEGAQNLFELRPCGPEDLVGNSAQLVVIDSVAFTDPDHLAMVYGQLRQPVLLLAPPDRIPAIVEQMRPADMVCMRGTPWSLLSHNLRHLFRLRGHPVDRLTGLPHRAQLVSRLEHLLPLASEAHPISLALTDIDHFKAINDQYGHTTGDMVLHQLASMSSTRCETADLAARYSGEQFGLLFLTHEPEALERLEALRRAIESERFTGEGVKLTVSIGLATTDEPLEPRELIRFAQEAVYAAKAEGRNRVRTYSSLRREAEAHDEDLALASFENLTRVVSQRIVETITRRGRQLYRDLRQQADVDALTNLYSRRYLDRQLDHDFNAAVSDAKPLTLALMDIDHFGLVNKQHGWPTGDRVLAEIAELVQASVRGSDWVGRYGGEELCLVMPDTALAKGRAVLERIRAAVESTPFRSTSGEPISVTVSIGAAELLGSDKGISELLERASDQLISAKQGGRNTVCV
jgi:diguanylate cyclase (GGDEF)-like protein